MKVATKVATGSGVLAALLIGVLAYLVLLVGHLVAVNRNLTTVQFRTTTVALDLLNQLDQLQENARKFFVTRDPGYASLASDARDAFAAGLAELETLAARGGAPAAVGRLAEEWRRFEFAAVPRQEMADRLAATSDADLLVALAAPLERLDQQTWAVLNASRAGIAAQVSAAAAAGRDAQRFSLAVAALAVLGAALIVALTVRSIEEPLRRLTEGTRAVARGTFSYQIDAPRGDEFAALASDFNTMVRRLGELDRMKKDFVSHVSHELRTPLVAMQETNRLLLDGLPGPLTDRQRRMLELNLQGSRRLSAMISNLLDLARLEAGTMRYDFGLHDLTAIVRSAAAELEAWALERGVRFAVEVPEGPLPAECDRDRTVQVVVNLVDNAAKFSPPNGTVTVRLRRSDSAPPGVPRGLAAPGGNGPFAVLEIADLGPGVPDRDKRLIFERFRQATAPAARRTTGVGLGLAICREIVGAHGGAIWAADNAPTGTVFSVVLPLHGRTAAGRATMAAIEADGT
jgi:two-component system sensor histidine kinase GlrK